MREQKEQGKQNELLRVIAEKNHEQVIEYDVKDGPCGCLCCGK